MNFERGWSANRRGGPKIDLLEESDENRARWVVGWVRNA